MLCRRIRHRDGLRRQHPRWSLSTIQAPTNMFEITKDGQVPRILSFKSFAINLYQRVQLRKAFQQMAKDDMDSTSNLGGKKNIAHHNSVVRGSIRLALLYKAFFFANAKERAFGQLCYKIPVDSADPSKISVKRLRYNIPSLVRILTYSLFFHLLSIRYGKFSLFVIHTY